MDRVKFITPTEKELGTSTKRALLIDCQIDDVPSMGEITLACGILRRAHHANAEMCLKMIEDEDFFKDAVKKYRRIS